MKFRFINWNNWKRENKRESEWAPNDCLRFLSFWFWQRR